MSDETKPDSIPLSQRPRSPRVPVNFTVELEGEGEGGEPFGRSLSAEVNGVWTDEADGRQHIGVKLLDPDGWFAE